jgi:hypothetical protein
MNLAALAATAPLFASNPYLLPTTLGVTGLSQARAEHSCQGTVDQISTKMRQMGTSVKVTVDIEYNKVFDLALQGQSSIYFLLSNERELGTRRSSVATNIMSSPVLMQSFVRHIFSRCLGTGLVSFGLSNTDWFERYAFTSTGSLLIKYCSHERSDPKFNKRATYVVHPTGPSLDGSCTYIYALLQNNMPQAKLLAARRRGWGNQGDRAAALRELV